MTSVLDGATANTPKAVSDLGVTTPSKPSGTDVDPMLQAKKLQRLGPPAAKARLVPVPKNGIKSPKRYASNGVRMSPVRRPVYQKQRGRRRIVNAGHEGLPIEAYTGTIYETQKKAVFCRKLNLNAQEFSPSFGASTSPIGMNPTAPEFSPSASSLGMSPLAKPFTRVVATGVDVGLSPLAAPFVPSAIPEQMPLMDLGQSLRSALSSLVGGPNPVCIRVDEKLHEIYDFRTL